MRKEYIAQSADDLKNVACEIIPLIINYPVVAFKGKMGSGKTALIKEICKLLQVKEVVTSPTFTLVNEYHTFSGKNIYHFDFYRIDRIEEIYDLGYEEYLYSGNICLIEWPEIVENMFLEDTLYVHINIDDKKRRHILIDLPILQESE